MTTGTPNLLQAATLLAAEHIEKRPQDFDFYEVVIPDCGTPGCALGWMAHFYRQLGGRRPDGGEMEDITDILPMLDMDDAKFYRRLDHHAGIHWHHHADLAAKGLRAFAAHDLVSAP